MTGKTAMKALKIKGSMRSRYNNALHAQFNDHVFYIVSSSQAAATSVPQDILMQWREAIDVEIDIGRTVQASAATAKMRDKDAERDALVTYLFEEVRNACRSPFAEKRRAANQLKIHTSRCRRLQKQAGDVKTMHIKGVVADMRTDQGAAYTSELGLTETVAMLETANNDYEELKGGRTIERAVKIGLPHSSDARRTTDELYDLVCKIIVVCDVLEANAEVKSGFSSLVAKMNQYIDETKTVYHQMAASGAGASEA